MIRHLVVFLLGLSTFVSAFSQQLCKTSTSNPVQIGLAGRYRRQNILQTATHLEQEHIHDHNIVASNNVATSSSKLLIVTKPPHRLSIHQFIYVILTSVFVTCLIIADVIGVKIFEFKLPFPIFGHTTVEHTCGMITFPITFLLGDIINEYYGPRASKDTIYIGLAMSILVFIVMNIAQALPYLNKPFNVTPAAFDMIFGSAKLMYIASITAYLIGQLCDVWLFGVIKRFTKGKYLWLRATGSTLISQLLDSFVVSYMAFSFGKSVTNQIPATFQEVTTISITGYGLKFVLSMLITPILYLLRDLLHKKFGFEALPPDYKEVD